MMKNAVSKMLLYFNTTKWFCVFPVVYNFKTRKDDKFFSQVLRGPMTLPLYIL